MTNTSHPHWVFDMKIEPKAKLDTERLMSALAQMAHEDPTFSYSQDPQSRELIVASINEDHLEAQLDALQRAFRIDFVLGAPQVRLKETLRSAAEVDFTYKKQSGASGQFARVKLKIMPNERGVGNQFESAIAGGEFPEEFIPSIEEGVRSVWRAGVLVGFPIVDTKVMLFDGSHHELDSTPAAFEIAARFAMEEGARKAGMKLLEPIMDVEVVTPGDCVGSVIGDINSRRGQIRGQEMRGNATALRAYVPMERMFGYISGLRAITGGGGTYEMRFSHYDEVRGRWNGPDDFPPAIGMRA